MSTWGAENANANYSRRVDRDRQRAAAVRQVRAAHAAGRGRRSL